MIAEDAFARYASAVERRTISREDLGYYNAVIISAIYEFSHDAQLQSPSSFFHPLNRCIEEFPFLGVIVGDPETNKPFYQRVAKINPEQHISIYTNHVSGHSELVSIESMLPEILDAPFKSGIPPWRIVVLPFSPTRCFVAFAYSHALGDGPSGVAFHRIFLNALREKPSTPLSDQQVIKVPIRPLPTPLDTPERLPISWSFLLAPIVNHLLPQFLRTLLGLRPAGSVVGVGTWTGSLVPKDAKGVQSRLKLLKVEAHVLQRVLAASRKNGARLTGVFQEIIARALSKAFDEPDITNFVCQTPVNLRKCLKIPRDEFANLGSACATVHPRVEESPPPSTIWEGARRTTTKLAECASTRQDQVIGLLRYISNIRNWLTGKLGQQRDCSFEVSNVGAFAEDDVENTAGHDVKLVEMIFAQPGHVLISPLAFSLASADGGSLFCAVTWQIGALGIKVGEEEGVVERVLCSIRSDLEAIGEGLV